MCYFYKHVHALRFILLYLLYPLSATNHGVKVFEVGLDHVSPKSVALQFYVILNNTSESEDFEVDLVPDRCCLDHDKVNVDCDSLPVFGGHVGILPRLTTRKVKIVSPVLNPYERHGHCTLFLDTKDERRTKSCRQAVNIEFSTKAKDLKTKNEDLKPCVSHDEDPLNDCKPVNCDVHYNGKRSFLDKKWRRCRAVPNCIALDSDVDVIYNPSVNLCVESDQVTDGDIHFIKNLNKNRNQKDLLIIENRRGNKVTYKPSDDESIHIKQIKDPKLKQMWSQKCSGKKSKIKHFLRKFPLNTDPDEQSHSEETEAKSSDEHLTPKKPHEELSKHKTTQEPRTYTCGDPSNLEEPSKHKKTSKPEKPRKSKKKNNLQTEEYAKSEYTDLQCPSEPPPEEQPCEMEPESIMDTPEEPEQVQGPYEPDQVSYEQAQGTYKQIQASDKLLEWIKFISSDSSNIAIFVCLTLIQCCVCYCCLHFFRNKTKCLCRKPRKGFWRHIINCRQETSITTPLIGSSIIDDTDTTEFRYFSGESSNNLEKNVRCYRSIQQEFNRAYNVKRSLSDDILSKCLNRRDWCRQTFDPIQDGGDVYENNIVEDKDEEYSKHIHAEVGGHDKTKEETYGKQIGEIMKEPSETKVNFENEKTPAKDATPKVKGTIRKLEKDAKSNKGTKISNEINNQYSEREINCHDYDYTDSASGNDDNEKLTNYAQTSFCNSESRSSTKEGTHTGVQATFPKDSIDDLMSKQGLFSITNDSKLSSRTSISSKTSKNISNVKAALSQLFRMKSRTGPSSYPGTNKSKEMLNVELIHMSHNSTYSSSNNESDCLKPVKKFKEANTSF